jgi:dimethylsulfoniopropionate demethylase
MRIVGSVCWQTDWWPATGFRRREVGYVTTAIWSPHFEKNVALAMIECEYWDASIEITVLAQDGIERRGVVSELPMED